MLGYLFLLAVFLLLTKLVAFAVAKRLVSLLSISKMLSNYSFLGSSIQAAKQLFIVSLPV